LPQNQKKRADVLIFELGLAESREQAQTMIMEGLVFQPSGRVLKSSTILDVTTKLEVRGRLPYVGRGGIKLAHALDYFQISVSNMIALDVGASTGGFTDCMLQRGACRVYAIDVGHGQIHHKIRTDERVTVIEKCNARYPFQLSNSVDLITIDVSFISLRLIIPSVAIHLKPGNPIVALVKPQFEAERGEVGRGGIVRDSQVHKKVMANITNWSIQSGFTIKNNCSSPITGDSGNKEFFLYLEKPNEH
jgi:23S rRNA (cytidine1920-2'-O)/16S rRNA (cytidine1409-2'-O)-methyltransferase